MIDYTPFDFADESSAQPPVEDTWKLFIVDDDKDIHEITKLALKDLKFKEKSISFVSAYSAKEAIELLRKHPQFAIVLLDIGMETNDAGLEVANYIRQQLKDDLTRIIIRTGQPGDVPEKEIIDNYDINDYKSKTELTLERLFTSIRTAIAQYDQIHELATINTELEERIEAALAKQKEQQEALFLQNRSQQMNELLNMIAHQWRQPLARVAAVTTQIKLSLALGEIDIDEFHEQIEHIQQYTNELSETIEEFRAIYEPSSRTQHVGIYKLIQKCASIISSSFKEQNISIDIHCSDEDKNRLMTGELYQVILNILKNSQEAFLQQANKAAKISVDIGSLDDQIEIKINDNAGGIKEEDLGKVFDPYFSTKENKVGHGLGLYMSKNIIEQHCNGQLFVDNTEEGVCFRILLAKP